MANIFNRGEMHDTRVVVMLCASLHVRSRDRAEMLDLSQSGYIRKLIIDDLKRADEKELSAQSNQDDTQQDAQLLRKLIRLLKAADE